jgi:cytochrome b subunit of formate dehydrogenase
MSEWARGVVFVLHGLAAMLSVTLVMTHIYMALRPEAGWMLRSMLVGWITREEYRLNFDDRGWRPQDAPRTTDDAADALP